MTEQTLTLNESAAIVKDIFADLVKESPESTNDARETSGEAYLGDECPNYGIEIKQLHEHHRLWTEAGLNDAGALDLADKLRERLRVVGNAALVARGLDAVPWYD